MYFVLNIKNIYISRRTTCSLCSWYSPSHWVHEKKVIIRWSRVLPIVHVLLLRGILYILYHRLHLFSKGRLGLKVKVFQSVLESWRMFFSPPHSAQASLYLPTRVHTHSKTLAEPSRTHQFNVNETILGANDIIETWDTCVLKWSEVITLYYHN